MILRWAVKVPKAGRKGKINHCFHSKIKSDKAFNQTTKGGGMPLKKRVDGTYLNNLHAFRRMIPYLMKTRTESILFYKVSMDLTKTLPFLEKINADRIAEEKITLFHIMLAAANRTIALRPQLNRFVMGKRLYQRNTLSINMVLKQEMTEKGLEINKKLYFQPEDTLYDIAEKANIAIKKAKQKKDRQVDQDEKEINFLTRLPRFLLVLIMKLYNFLDYFNMAPASMVKADPLYCSVFLASLGSMGLDSLYHHMFEWGTNSVFMLVGKIKKEVFVDEKENIGVRDVVSVSFSLDDRVSEAIYFKKALDLVQGFVENPELLEHPADIPDNIRQELNLKAS